jgi:hypothetical protein
VTFGGTPWTSDQPVARPLLTRGNTNQKQKDKHLCLERDRNSWSQRPSDQDLRDRHVSSLCHMCCEPGSSVSIVSGYWLDDRAIKVRCPAEAKDFSSNLCVQTGSGAHPASCTMDTGGPSPGVKRGRGVTLTIYLHLVPRSRMSRSYTSSPPSAFMACSGTDLDLAKTGFYSTKSFT